MVVTSSMVTAVCHEKAAPGKVECDCAACWQVRQLRLAPGRASGSEAMGRAFGLRQIGGVL
jgi:hypothetical protein